MPNLRAQITMTDEEVRAFLDGRQTMSFASFCPDGTVHLVAMWYGFVDGQIAIETKAKSQKAQNLMRDSRFSALLEGGHDYAELHGVELVGRVRLVDDPDVLWQIGCNVYERYFGPVTPEAEPLVAKTLRNRVGFFLDVERTVTWDHRKMGG